MNKNIFIKIQELCDDTISKSKKVQEYFKEMEMILELVKKQLDTRDAEIKKWRDIAIEERAKYLSAEEASGWDFKRGALCNCNDCMKEPRFEKDRIRLREQATEDLEKR